MKLTSIIIASGTLLITQACDQKPVPTVNSSPLSPSAPPSPIPTANPQAEAISEAEKEWAKVWVQTGDTWMARAKESAYLLQIKDRRPSVQAQSLSDADRLNGVQWSGSVAFRCSAARKFGFASNAGGLTAMFGGSGSEYNVGWNEWFTPEGAIAVYRLKKQRGKWTSLERGMNEVVQLQSGDNDMVRPTETDLQKSAAAEKQ